VIFQDLLIRARLAVDSVVEPFRYRYAPPPRNLKLDSLEDRVLLSAAPVAMAADVVDAAPVNSADQAFDQAAGDLSAQDASYQPSAPEVVAGLPTEPLASLESGDLRSEAAAGSGYPSATEATNSDETGSPSPALDSRLSTLKPPPATNWSSSIPRSMTTSNC